MKIRPFFRWYDLWIGGYVDRKNKKMYICPVPMVGIMIDYMTKEEKLNRTFSRILQHQNNSLFHPLTCGADSNHHKLYPTIQDGKIILKCPECYYWQETIPRFLIEEPN